MTRVHDLELHSRGLSDEEDDSDAPMTLDDDTEESLPPFEGAEEETQRHEERFEFTE